MSRDRRIVQICAVVKDLEASMRKFWELMGIGPWDVYTFSPDNVREYTLCGREVKEPFKFKLAVAMLGDVQFELVEPVEGPTIYAEFLEEKGEGWHHVKEFVPDEEMAATLKGYEKRGLGVVQGGKFDEDVFYYLNTEPELGVIFELGNLGKVRSPERRYPEDA